ncbi:heme-binding beta-barrel domain-containing protein [Novosphingobium humi]|uniref:Heme-binding beta-barrel domain-containing protein n=1 Tax=Novosphingobium humi TaxID=2282397 RepID=A0ABY7TY65_9SPHN|nr:heme-binding beta-barrel domain-containing protein [Novosphingobium humi]WCT77976.1 heme-binding beta-barrel domain-containing protein [Novosphingobium humi]
MSKFPAHLFAEPEPDVDTLANLGPLAPMAGVWEGIKGRDVKPTEDGAEEQVYIERMTIQPIDPQMNGPQLLYGLRYHTAITKPGEVEMYHDQVGYWLWEPATGRILHTLTIPRGQAALAKGEAAADATSFTLSAQRGSTENGIISAVFLEENFRTDSFAITVTIDGPDQWSYEQTTMLQIRGVEEPFAHTDRNTLRRVGPAVPNPLARENAEA